MFENKFYIDCDCLCYDHQARLMYDEETLYLDYILKDYQGIFSKIKNVLKFLFNRECYFFSETLISKEKAKELIKYLQEFTDTID